jgi:nucleoside-diphosphate-sugar epimerase
MATLVTGATGYIGRRVALRLVRQGQRLRVLCRDAGWLDPEIKNSPLVEVMLGDLGDADIVRRACADMSGIIHLAAGTGGSAEEFDRSTLGGTTNLLEAAEAAGVSRIVYVSSMSVYDYSSMKAGSLVDENAPLESHPEKRDNYARSKRVAEDIVARHVARGKLSISVVRPGIVYGPNNRSPFVPVTALRRLPMVGFLLVGGGRRQVPLIYVENLVDALLLLLECEGCGGRIYNVIDNDPRSERDYLATLERTTGVPLKIQSVPVVTFLPLMVALEVLRRARRKKGMNVVHGLLRVTKNIRFDAGRLQRELGWRSRVGLEEALRESFGTPAPAAAAPRAVQPFRAV